MLDAFNRLNLNTSNYIYPELVSREHLKYFLTRLCYLFLINYTVKQKTFMETNADNVTIRIISARKANKKEEKQYNAR